MKSFVLGLCGLLAVLCLTLPARAAGDRERSVYEYNLSDAKRAPGTLLRSERMALPAFFRAKGWRILFATRDYAGRPVVSSGFVILPSSAPADPAQRKIVAWAHPTTGIARSCAPSLFKNPAPTVLGINELVMSGHIIAAADYAGLGAPGTPGYLIGLGQARAVIDSVRAARQIPGVGGGGDYALWGYSQGAHAAIFASRISKAYAPELRLKGVAAVAPPSDLAALLRANLSTTAGRVLASFTIGSWSKKFNLDPFLLVDPAAASSVNRINATCLDNLADKMSIFETQSNLKERFLLADPTRVPGWRERIISNSINTLSSQVPAIVFQGTADEVVRPAATRAMIANSCRNGAAVKFVELKSKGHGSAAKFSVGLGVAWINSRLKGEPPPSTC